jgi:hypothetical protein
MASPAEGPKPVDICEVLKQMPKYTDQSVTIHGAVVRWEHGAYLVSVKECGPTEYSGIRIENLPPNPKISGKGIKHPAIVEGRLSISTRPLPRWSGKPYASIVVQHLQLGSAF